MDSQLHENGMNMQNMDTNSEMEFMMQMARASLKELKNTAAAEIRQLLSRLDDIAANPNFSGKFENSIFIQEPCGSCDPGPQERTVGIPDLKRSFEILENVQQAMQVLEIETKTKWNKDSLGAVSSCSDSGR